MTATRPVALVTGASSGIGKAAALALVEAGFGVVGTSRNTSRVTPRDGVTFLDLDVTSDESVTSGSGESTSWSTTPASAARALPRKAPSLRTRGCSTSTSSASSA
jgi:NAD(P)-dependent dehydrogenase (short-subunit alcohol dehydrogenase family)